jgi:predicted CoA-binding protein
MSTETPTDAMLHSLLDLERIAVVGASSTPGKAAHDVPRYLSDRGYEIVPVNPFAETVLGRPAYDSLTEVEEPVELVDVFRPSEEVSGIVDEALARPDQPAIWLQLDITDDAALARARAAGVTMVQDLCLKVEHQRLRS